MADYRDGGGGLERGGLMALPPELLVMVLARVRLLDLANLRQVCQRLQQMVDGAGGRRLWATVSLEGLAVCSTHLPLMERAAGCGNKEALIKLAMAFLYNQGVPKGAGAGTLDSCNGLRAAELLLQLDAISPTSRPLSWFLVRPPWSSSVSNKVCAHHKMAERCLNQTGAPREKGREVGSGLFYSLGQTANFLEVDGKVAEEGETAMDWFERGASHDCLFSALEVWRQTMKPNLAVKEVPAIRSLRKIVAMGNHTSSLDAKLELCRAYAGGHWGSVCGEEALSSIRDLMAGSRPSLSHRMFRVQRDITNIMRFITVDWMIEIAELKSLSRHTLHQAVTLFDAYLLSRQVDRSALQLLGVTSILVASRWSGATMLTIREASWLTENTYSYEEVARMMAELLGAFQGDIQRLTMSDYLEVLLTLVQAGPTVQSMTSFLSEGVLLYPSLTRFSSAQLAAACLLNAQVLLRQDYPWPVCMEQATGFSISSLSSCCLMIYQRCLTKEFAVADHRGVELCAIVSRYSHPSQHSISKLEIMSLEQFSEQLGVTSDLSSAPQPTPQRSKDKLLSFLSDSCYLSSPLWFSGSDSESEPESDLVGGEGLSECGLRPSAGERERPTHVAAAAAWVSPLAGGRGVELAPPPTLSPNSPLHQDNHPIITMVTTADLSHTHSPIDPMAASDGEGLRQKLSPHHHPSPPLARHRSLISCDSAHCSLVTSDKTDRVHVSCPDFHSHSTDDMELGSVSQDEEPEEMETGASSLERDRPQCAGELSEALDFNLPPLGEPNFPPNPLGAKNSPFSTTPSTSIDSPAGVHRPRGGGSGVKNSPARGSENPQHSRSSKGGVPSLCRNPLQSLTNTPSILRHSSKQEKPVLPTMTKPEKPAHQSNC